MKNSRIRLPYKVLFFIAVLFSVFVLWKSETIDEPSTQTVEFFGTILSYKVDGNQLTLEVKGNKKIMAYYYFKTEEEKNHYQEILAFGQQIKLEGVFQLPSKNRNFHLFDYRNFLKSKGIRQQMSILKLVVLDHKVSYPYQFKNRLWKHIASFSRADQLKLFLFGSKEEVDPVVMEQYQACGISHLMAVSGMHVGILLGIAIHIFGSPKRFFSYLALVLFLFFYSFLAGFTPSILRASCFFALLHGKKFLHIASSNLESFLFLVSIFLIVCPYYWYHVGFLFSFLISFFLLWMRMEPTNYWKGLFETSCGTFLISIPLMLRTFFSINLLTPIYNLLFVPLVTFLIFPLALATLVLPFLEPLFNGSIDLLERTAFWCSQIPSSLSFAQLSVLQTLFFTIFLFWVLHKWKKGYPQWMLLVPLLLGVLYFLPSLVQPSKLVILDVGQGDATLLQFDGRAVLIDTGGMVSFPKEAWKQKRKSYSIADSILIPYLKASGIHYLDALFLTHGDFDHAGEAISLLQKFKVNQVFFNLGEKNSLEQQIEAVLNKKRIPYRALGVGCFFIGKQQFCSWNDGTFLSENDNSLVLDTKIKQQHILLMGDASKEVEEKLGVYFESSVDILKVGHHGSRTSTSASFLKKIRPKYATISVGDKNRYGHPHQETLQRLEEYHIRTFLTSRDGMIEFQFNEGLSFRTCYGVR